MKRNKVINVFIFIMCLALNFIGAISIVEAKSSILLFLDCGSVLSPNQAAFLQNVFIFIRVITPVLVLVLIMKDFVQAVASQKEEDMKKAQTTAIKRIIVGVVIMFVPTIVNLLLDLMARNQTTCGIK